MHTSWATAILLVLTLSFSTQAFACRFNTDCEVGSKCMKEPGKLNGYCEGGLNPGNQNDRKPYHDPLDITGSVGDTCRFNTDCGIGAKCVKEAGALNGVCRK